MASETFSDLPGWSFTVEERSVGVYVALGRDESGRSVQRSGTDPDELLDQCRADAHAIAG